MPTSWAGSPGGTFCAGDRYLTEQPRCLSYVAEFLTWAACTGLTTDLTVPRPRRTEPAVTLSDEDRLAQIDLLLHDDTIRLYARVAGLLTLLFAQPLARVVAMPASGVQQRHDGTVTVTFDATPVELPHPLDELVLRQLQTRGLSSYATRPDPWLFPGGVPGRHLVTECVRAELVAHGIHPRQASMAALFQLAGQVPTAVLADLLGISRNAAGQWAALSARDWARYTADRKSNPKP